jgi:hypothetical protein
LRSFSHLKILLFYRINLNIEGTASRNVRMSYAKTFNLCYSFFQHVGTSNWQICGDYLCTAKEYQDIQLNLNSACEFNCFNGDCVLMSQRCNGICNCHDCSDEEGCKVLDNLVSYNKGILTSPNGSLAPVVFSATVSGLGGIDDNAGTVSLNFAVSIEWYDFRLVFLNLSPNM